jgi:hypothetical protein
MFHLLLDRTHMFLPVWCCQQDLATKDHFLMLDWLYPGIVAVQQGLLIIGGPPISTSSICIIVNFWASWSTSTSESILPSRDFLRSASATKLAFSRVVKHLIVISFCTWDSGDQCEFRTLHHWGSASISSRHTLQLPIPNHEKDSSSNDHSVILRHRP